MQLTRRYRFSASHRLHSDQLTAQANSDLYGKCNNPYGHGHNYVLDVTVAGPVDPATGRVVDLGALDRCVQQTVLERFDHRDLNSDVDDFSAVVSTTENLAVVIDRRLRQAWASAFAPAVLKRIHIEETKRNSFELSRDEDE